MDISISDLRANTQRVLKAIRQRERVRITYHGKAEALIVPVERPRKRVRELSFFGMSKKSKVPSVADQMHELREQRFRVD